MKMKISYILLVLAGLLLVTGCEEQENTPGSVNILDAVGVEMDMEADYLSDEEEGGDYEDAENPKAEIVERKLIKEGEVEFETGDLRKTKATILEALSKYKGYVSSDRERKYSGRLSNTLVVRIPSESFDLFLAESTQGVERFDEKEIRVKDVTEEFLDIQARLGTKKELEQRFLDLLKEAKNVTEVLEIERELGDLRADIESMEGRLKFLENQVFYSTLYMTFYERTANENAFGQQFVQGFGRGWDYLIWFFVGLTHIWPFLLLGIGTFYGIRFYIRRKKRKKLAASKGT